METLYLHNSGAIKNLAVKYKIEKLDIKIDKFQDKIDQLKEQKSKLQDKLKK
jgi:predicted transcriptional regulator